MAAPDDVAIVAFRGAVASKARPAIVVSSGVYHQARPDCVVGILTSNPLADRMQARRTVVGSKVAAYQSWERS